MRTSYQLLLLILILTSLNCSNLRTYVGHNYPPKNIDYSISSIHYAINLSSKFLSTDKYIVDHSKESYTTNSIDFTYSRKIRPKTEVKYSLEELREIGIKNESDLLLLIIDTEHVENIMIGSVAYRELDMVIDVVLFEVDTMDELWSATLNLKEFGVATREEKGIKLSNSIISEMKKLNYLPSSFN